MSVALLVSATLAQKRIPKSTMVLHRVASSTEEQTGSPLDLLVRFRRIPLSGF